MDGIWRAAGDELAEGPKSGVSGQAADEDILQVAAIEEHSVVARTGNEIERVGGIFGERKSQIQIFDEEPVPVVAELGNHDQWNILAVHQGVGSDSGPQRHAEIPFSDGNAFAGSTLAIVIRSRSAHLHKTGEDRDKTY
jgi:hypothetical protein